MLTPPPINSYAKRIKSIGLVTMDQRLKITKFVLLH